MQILKDILNTIYNFACKAGYILTFIFPPFLVIRIYLYIFQSLFRFVGKLFCHSCNNHN